MESVESTAKPSDETRENLLSGAQGGNTATGLAKQTLENPDARPEGPRGSETPIVGGEPQPDSASPENVGNQNEPALYAVNGSLPVAHVSSPSGLVPVSAVTDSHEVAEQKLQAHYDSLQAKPATHEGFKKISRAQIESANAAELRAAASDRGWDLGESAGSRVTRARFIAKQNEELGSDSETADTAAE